MTEDNCGCCLARNSLHRLNESVSVINVLSLMVIACLSFHYGTLVYKMEILNRFSGIVLALIMVDVIAATVIQDICKKLESGENITGIIIIEAKVRTLEECAFR